MDQKVTFTEGKILKPLILFAMPVLFALFLQAMYGAVDLLIVGQFASSADVTAVSYRTGNADVICAAAGAVPWLYVLFKKAE